VTTTSTSSATATITSTPTSSATPSVTLTPTATLVGVNLASAASGAQVVAASSNYGGGWDRTRLIDGSVTSGWSAAYGQTTGQWVVVDLSGGGTYLIGSARVNGAATGGDTSNNNLRS